MKTSQDQDSGVRVFFSYASEDYGIVDDYYYELQNEGYVPFLDRYRRDPDRSHNEQLEQEVKSSDYVVFFLSQYSVEPGYPTLELRWAREKWGRVRGHIVVVELAEIPREQWPAPLRGADPVLHAPVGPEALVNALNKLCARPSSSSGSISRWTQRLAALATGSVLTLGGGVAWSSLDLRFDPLRASAVVSSVRLEVLAQQIDKLDILIFALDKKLHELTMEVARISARCIDGGGANSDDRVLLEQLRAQIGDTESARGYLWAQQRQLKRSEHRERQRLRENVQPLRDIAPVEPDWEGTPLKKVPPDLKRFVDLVTHKMDEGPRDPRGETAFETFLRLDRQIDRWFMINEDYPEGTPVGWARFQQMTKVSKGEIAFHSLIFRYIETGEIDKAGVEKLSRFDSGLYDKAMILLQ